MRSLSIRMLIALSILVVPTFAFASVTVNGTNSFASLDGGPDDADHSANGVFTVNGDLIVNGTINCNDATSGAGNSACPMQFVVSGNLDAVLGQRSLRREPHEAGNGGNISFIVGGNVLIQGTACLACRRDGLQRQDSMAETPPRAATSPSTPAAPFSQEHGSIVSSAANDATPARSRSPAAARRRSAASLRRSVANARLHSVTPRVLSGGGGHSSAARSRSRRSRTSEPAVVIPRIAIIASQGCETCRRRQSGHARGLQRPDRRPRRRDGSTGTAPRVVVRSGTTLTVDGSTLAGVGGAPSRQSARTPGTETRVANRTSTFTPRKRSRSSALRHRRRCSRRQPEPRHDRQAQRRHHHRHLDRRGSDRQRQRFPGHRNP